MASTPKIEPTPQEEPVVSKWANGPEKFKRNEYGLLENVDYVFEEDGRINWRAMIDPKFLYPNADWFKSRNQPVPDSIEGLEDNQLLIMLGGIKELAQLRGYSLVEHKIQTINEGYVVDTCEICWIPNYESGSFAIVFQDTANATTENCSGFGTKFLETIAANRAFVRAVRNFLNIHIVGADEIDKSKNKVIEAETGEPVLPSMGGALKKLAAKQGIESWEAFKDFLRGAWVAKTYQNDAIKTWNDFSDIDGKDCRAIMKIIKNMPKEEVQEMVKSGLEEKSKK